MRTASALRGVSKCDFPGGCRNRFRATRFSLGPKSRNEPLKQGGFAGHVVLQTGGQAVGRSKPHSQEWVTGWLF